MSPITLEDIRSRAIESVFVRGEGYYRQGAIFGAFRHENTLAAACRGSAPYPYSVRVVLDEEGEIQETDCTCPYQGGGDCKHVVALLLTYYHHPEKFEQALSASGKGGVQASLAARSKEQLIALIHEMLARHPDLSELLARPIPDPQKAGQPIETQPIRRELRRALEWVVEEWHSHTVMHVIESVMRNAQQFAQVGDWANASRIYVVLIEELLNDNVVLWDEEGQLAEKLGAATQELLKCLAQPQVAQDETIRRKVIGTLTNVLLWGIDDGIDYIDFLDTDIIASILLAHLQADERAAFRERIMGAKEFAEDSPYNRYALEFCEDVLFQLDLLEGADVESALQRLREKGLYHLVFEKLLALQRHQEALAAAEQIADFDAQLRAWSALAEVGLEEEAIRLAQSTFRKDYNGWVGEWLAARYRARGDHEALFQHYWRWMQESPGAFLYAPLRKAAQAVGKWDQIRPQLIRTLEQAKEFGVLATLYLDDEEWDKAWDVVEQARGIYADENLWELRGDVAARSKHARPRKAIPIYLERVHANIDMRDREYYAQAARDLLVLRELYKQIGEEATWEKLISELRKAFRRRRALQDELNKAGL